MDRSVPIGKHFEDFHNSITRASAKNTTHLNQTLFHTSRSPSPLQKRTRTHYCPHTDVTHNNARICMWICAHTNTQTQKYQKAGHSCAKPKVATILSRYVPLERFETQTDYARVNEADLPETSSFIDAAQILLLCAHRAQRACELCLRCTERHTHSHERCVGGNGDEWRARAIVSTLFVRAAIVRPKSIIDF